MSTPYDVIVIGGGVIGGSVAYHLAAADAGLRVVVVERDPTYARASSALSVGNARIQFGLEQNIQMSQYTFEVLERFDEEMSVEGESPHIGFRRDGNLFLVDENGRGAAEEALTRQQQLGGQVEWWSPDEIKERYPLYEPHRFVGGTFGAADGHLDGYAMLMGYKSKAVSLGAEYLEDEVARIATSGGKITGVDLASGERLVAGIVVNCAGAWAARVVETVGVELPVVPTSRQVFVVDPAVKPSDPLPLTALPTGFYFRSEGEDRLVVGRSLPEDVKDFVFRWDETRFTDVLWPELAEFVPAFESLRVVRGWAGLYAVNTLDSNAILGEWPEMEGLFLANGFSGHGLQQAPAVGRYLAELITSREPSLDLSIFSPARILENRPLDERHVI